jgi:hypothetical protein
MSNAIISDLKKTNKVNNFIVETTSVSGQLETNLIENDNRYCVSVYNNIDDALKGHKRWMRMVRKLNVKSLDWLLIYPVTSINLFG